MDLGSGKVKEAGVHRVKYQREETCRERELWRSAKGLVKSLAECWSTHPCE